MHFLTFCLRCSELRRETQIEKLLWGKVISHSENIHNSEMKGEIGFSIRQTMLKL